MSTLHTRLAAAAVLALLACSDDDNSSAGDAELRATNADATSATLDVDVGGTTVINGLAYGHTSGVVQVPSGTQEIVVRSGGTVIAELNSEISSSVINSLLVSAGSAQLASQVDPDTGAVAPARANLRLVNVASGNTDEPVLLEAKLRAPAPDSVMTFGVDTRIARYGSLMYFDAGEFTMWFVPAGGSDVLATVTFNVAAGEAKAVVLERAASGEYTATVVVEN
jgi:hypothetical protein